MSRAELGIYVNKMKNNSLEALQVENRNVEKLQPTIPSGRGVIAVRSGAPCGALHLSIKWWCLKRCRCVVAMF